MTEAYYPEVENKEISDLLKGKEGIIFYDENNNEIEIGTNAHFQYIKNMHEGISDEFAWEEVKLDVLNTVGNNLEAKKIEVKKEIISETKQKIQEVKYDVENSIKSNDIAGEYRPTAVEESYNNQSEKIEKIEEIKPIEIQPENVEEIAETYDYDIDELFNSDAEETVFDLTDEADSMNKNIEKNLTEPILKNSYENSDSGTINDVKKLLNDENLGGLNYDLYSGKWNYYVRGEELSTLKNISKNIAKENIGEIRLIKKIIDLKKEIIGMPSEPTNYSNNIRVGNGAMVYGNTNINENGYNYNSKNIKQIELNNLISDLDNKSFNKYKTLEDY